MLWQNYVQSAPDTTKEDVTLILCMEQGGDIQERPQRKWNVWNESWSGNWWTFLLSWDKKTSILALNTNSSCRLLRSPTTIVPRGCTIISTLLIQEQVWLFRAPNFVGKDVRTLELDALTSNTMTCQHMSFLLCLSFLTY